MKKNSIMSFLFTSYIAIILLLLIAQPSFAESKKFDEKCSYDGKKIVSDFKSDRFASAIKNMEPGDTLDYTITYTNNSDKTTYWYLRNEVLETLEDNKEQARNGGYVYILMNGDETLFDNSKVGGEGVTDKLKGLKQADTATKNFFFIQQLEPKESQQTKLHVELDGETEANDYMDTHGALLLKYAVQDKEDAEAGSEPKSPSIIRTGDMNRIIYYAALLGVSLILFVIAIVVYRRDRRKGEEE